ncbi:dehydroascorbate transporter [Salmonella sp. NCTC 11881]|nr:dehydroascorbate transporter [Salmonella sp. NCTC 11881]
MAVVIFLCCLLGGIAIGLPIAWSLLLCGAALMAYLDMFDVQIMAQTLVNGADSFSLLAIPFFVLAGEIMNAGGLSKRIVDLPMKLVGHKPGGLGYVGVIAAMIMASLSGSAVADTAAVAALLVPMMRSANYPINRSVGLIASGGIIAPIIPPSIPFIIFGVSSGLSISKLFMAGIAPGIMMGAALMLTWWWQAGRLNLPSQPKATPREIWQSLVSGIWALFFTGDYHRRLPFRTFHANGGRGGRRVLRPLCRRGYLSGINVFQSLPRAGQCRQNDVSRHVSGGCGPGIRLADYDRGITHDGVRFAAAAGRLSATLIYRHYDLNYGRRYGDGFDANGVNSYPCIIAIS